MSEEITLEDLKESERYQELPDLFKAPVSLFHASNVKGEPTTMTRWGEEVSGLGGEKISKIERVLGTARISPKEHIKFGKITVEDSEVVNHKEKEFTGMGYSPGRSFSGATYEGLVEKLEEKSAPEYLIEDLKNFDYPRKNEEKDDAFSLKNPEFGYGGIKTLSTMYDEIEDNRAGLIYWVQGHGPGGKRVESVIENIYLKAKQEILS